MFEKAARLKLRFEWRGSISVEDLWDLSLENLDEIYKLLSCKMKSASEDSLLQEETEEDEILGLQVDIVKYIFSTKVAEKEAAENEAIKAARKQKILEIIEQKQNEGLMEMSVEGLKELIAE